MRIASDDELAAAASRLAGMTGRLSAYPDEMLAHPIAGHCLRNYGLLTDCPELVASLGLSTEEQFWSRYYWLARFARHWQAIAGDNAGLQQHVFQLLESAEHLGLAYDPLPEVEAAIERDALVGPPES